MTVQELQAEILRLKKEKDVCILAHSYVAHEILEIADFTGDSFALAQKAKGAPQKNMLMVGVRFMAETVKILSPEKNVWLAHPEAGCPMAEQISADELKALKKEYPGYTVAAYINTTAELKTVCDVCVTSSSALKIIKNLDNPDILFIPDCNLGAWIAAKVPEKNIRLMKGGCPAHTGISAKETERIRALYPNAKLLVHPECLPEVTAQADYAGSTTGIMDYAKQSRDKEFIIGTENSIVQHLQFECPDKQFYALSKDCICSNMKLTTLMDVYRCVCGTGGEEIILADDVMEKARRCIDTMLTLG